MKKILLVATTCLFFGTAGLQAQGFSDNFNAGSIGTGWQGTGAYSLTQTGGYLKIKCGTFEPNSVFTLDLGANTDISANPVVNLKLRCDNPCILRLTLKDASGTAATKDVRITSTSPNFVNYCFDFTSATLNKAQIKTVEFSTNPAAQGFGGVIYFEDLFIGGGSASKFANLCPISDMTLYKGGKDCKFYITDVANASGVTVTGGGAQISNLSVSAGPSSGIYVVTLLSGAPGTALITVTATGTGGYSNNTSQFTLTVEDNIVPTIDIPADAKVPVGKDFSIKLTGISDGNAGINQPITVTAVSGTPATIPHPTISYTSPSPYATLTVKPTAAGSSVITVSVTDTGAANNKKDITFNISSYNGYNYVPTVNTPLNQTMFLTAGTKKVKLTGITDGDGGSQVLNITASGKHATVFSAVTPAYTQGRDTAILTLTAAGLGKDTITVTIADDGDNGSNNGDQSVVVTFIAEVLQPAPTGFVIPMTNFTADTTAKLWHIEELGTTQFATYVDTLGTKCLRITCVGKSTYTGLWYDLYKIPKELDLSKSPYMSYEIFAKGFNPILTHAYFWDVDSQRNTNAAHLERDTFASMTAFQKVFLDFRKPTYLDNDLGVPIKADRISTILFNVHDKFAWPFTSIDGVFYLRDIRFGDSCKGVPAITPVCTIDPQPNFITWAGSGTHTLELTGISDGAGSTTGVTIQVLSSKVAFVPVPTLSAIGADGKATLTFTPGSTVDSSQIVLRVNKTGSIMKEIRFYIKSVSDQTANATVTVDASTVGATITGFGAMAVPDYQLDRYAKDQGCTFMRITIDEGIEPQNDNADPSVMNRNGFDLSKLDFDYIRKASAAGVTDFFVTLWSPPAWMMQSLSAVAVEGAPAWNVTLQKADPIYYDEYVEYMVSIVRLIKEETGVEIAAFSPQNEPAFTEPYGSAILDPQHYAQVSGLLGKRLAQEGFKTKTIIGEPVFGQQDVAYINAAKVDSLNKYIHVFGTHYPNTNAAYWASVNAACKGTYPKELWGTECSTHGNEFNGVMNEAEIIITALNNGCGGWAVWGYNNGSSSTEATATANSGMMSGSGTLKNFWMFKNFAKYIPKGMVQVKSTVAGNSSIVSAAFKNAADSTMTIVLLNKDTKMPYSVKLAGSAPSSGWSAYRTSFYEKCIPVDIQQNGLVSLAPRSITTLRIKADKNNAPSIDQAIDKFIPKNGSGSVNLTGISCGDPMDQSLTITATSDRPDIMPNPTVTYTSPATTGKIDFAPLADKAADVTIRVLVKDNGGIANGGVDSTVMTFKVVIPTSLDDISDKAAVYPNPASEKISVVLPSELLNSKLTITNSNGQNVLIQTVQADQMEINVSNLASGSYVVTVSNNASVAKLTFIKK